ncbi:MAG: metallophosphoesterase, partial [Propionibacteriaceae bacterium]|nr:metallophosphoesterase [Propionibacteriaceae bacterium]
MAPSSIYLIDIPFLLAVMVAGWYCYVFGLAVLPGLPRAWRHVVRAVVAVFAVGGLAAKTVSPYLPGIAAWRPVTTVFLTGAAVLFYLALGLALVIAADFVWRRVERSRAPESAPGLSAALPPAGQPGRRTSVWRIAVGAVVAVSVGLTAYGSYAFRHPVTTEVTVAKADLPVAFAGFRIALVTDIHVGPVTGAAEVRALVGRVNAAQPDLVVIAGDTVSGPARQLCSELAALADLEAPEGVVITTGNHEFRFGVDEWLECFAGLGLRVLDNAVMRIERRDETIDVIGVNDRQGSGAHAANLPKAAAELSASPRGPTAADGRFRLLVAHEPVQAKTDDGLPRALGVDVQLSGHTHGGQLWPLG